VCLSKLNCQTSESFGKNWLKSKYSDINNNSTHKIDFIIYGLNKNINSRFFGAQARPQHHKIGNYHSTFPANKQLTATHLAKMNYLTLLLIALVAMAPSAVEARKGKGKLCCILSLHHVYGL
jgi:hypothetical protein